MTTSLTQPSWKLTGRTAGAPVRAVAPATPTRKKTAKKRARKSRGPSTREAMIEILRASEKPLRVAQIVERLAASGCETKSVNPKNMVGAMLAQSSDFKRVDRGLYTVKKP